MSTFAERLAQAIEEDGRTIAEITRACGIGQPMIYKYTHGTSYPRKASIDALCKGLGITERWLTSGLGEKSAEKEKETAMKAEAERKFHATRVVNGKDKRQLEDIELVISHIRDMNLSSDEMLAVYTTLAEIRNELECKVLFNGMTA